MFYKTWVLERFPLKQTIKYKKILNVHIEKNNNQTSLKSQEAIYICETIHIMSINKGK